MNRFCSSIEKEEFMYAGYTGKILKELEICMKAEERDNYQDICKVIDEAGKIFVAGVGRTGLIMKCFAMRLAQAGYDVYWVGDVNTPGSQSGDLLILGSGSGETGALKNYAEKAGRYGVRTLVFTIDGDSALGLMADKVVLIQAAGKYERASEKTSIQPMGSLFEEALFIITESIVLELMEKNHIEEICMQKRHANLE